MVELIGARKRVELPFLFTESRFKMLILAQWLGIAVRSSKPPMEEVIGRLKIAQRLTICGTFHFLTQITGPLSVKAAQSRGQLMEEVTGLERPVVRSTSYTMCLLPMLTLALSLAISARFSEEQDPGRLQLRRQRQRLVLRPE